MIGLKPDHPHIKEKVLKEVYKMAQSPAGEEFVKNVTKGRQNWSIYEQGFDNVVSSRYEAMLETFVWLKEKYGNVEDYFEEKLGLGLEDQKIIKDSLLAY
ncbi:unnamed protein product [Ambrosiozyma monospora]|uniref:Unnamed protein product n=1 Tax=Ambrosiozyma monospora TaxID=43982 RepID=A0ACB5U7F2_AMBMO|nr:unnamed protein product [Ambrosiozyma monospora]